MCIRDRGGRGEGDLALGQYQPPAERPPPLVVGVGHLLTLCLSSVRDMDLLAYSDSRVHSGAEAVFARICGGLVGSGARVVCATAPENLQLREALRDECGDAEFLDIPAMGDSGRIARGIDGGSRRGSPT